MTDGAVAQVQILADGDVLRAERLARSLIRDLAAVASLDVRPAEAGSSSAPPGAKGTELLNDASMWVFLTAGAHASARVLLATIQAWLERDRNRRVRLTIGDRSIELPATTTASQERLVKLFLREGGQ
ncbi:hypothetical protein QQG74_24215 [Micromonospora sp. FIMYZ51]|uniref:hypothetical protein n=1 Tax=Micromonospora sp. FIMYZ51 TaxID=3051832 RepID=UPI00312030F4